MAPWVHSFLSPQGERRLCCTSREEHTFQKQYIDIDVDKEPQENFSPTTLAEHWNSDYMKNIRKSLMQGDRIPQCEVCNGTEFNSNSYRNWFNSRYAHYVDSVFENTVDGATTLPVISFDYRFSNLCNFKCRMCGEQLSSSWEAEVRKHDGDMSNPHRAFMRPEIKAAMQQFQHNVAEVEFLDAIDRGIVEEIYWTGGEPLMFDIHWKTMQRLVDSGNSKNCVVRYNTNLSKITYQSKSLYDYLRHFKDWQICASIDGVGKNVEMMRKGIEWEVWLKNFKEGVALENGHDRMIVDLTITGPGLFSLKELFDIAVELDVRIETKIIFAFHPNKILSPFAWPRAILDGYLIDLINYIEPRATHKQQGLLDVLRNMMSTPNFEQRWPDQYLSGLKQGKRTQLRLDTIRKEQYTLADVFAKDDSLFQWWNSL